jgi:hypothetical protein
MVINGQERMMGEMEYPDGGKYTGQLHGDERNGLGSYFRVDGSKLFGEWVNNRLHGVACQWQTNHYMFCSIWVDGEINGLGIYRAGDKTSSLVGYYVGNKVPGCGIWTTEANGTMVVESLYGEERCAWWNPLCWHCSQLAEDTLKDMVPLSLAIVAMRIAVEAAGRDREDSAGDEAEEEQTIEV